MNAANCARCGQMTMPAQLVYAGDGQQICRACEADAESREALRKSVLNTTLGAPALPILGWVLFCFPLINMFAPGLCGLAGALMGVNALRLFMDLNSRELDTGVSDAARAMLIVSACIALLMSLGLMGTQAMMWLGMMMF